MVGMNSPASLSNDSARSVLYSTLRDQYPQVPPDDIIAIIQTHGHDAGLCRQLVQEASSRSNPVFSRIHNLPSQPGVDGYRWPVAMMPACVDRNRPRATNDSGIHTLSPTPQILGPPVSPASPSVSPTSMTHTPPSPTPGGGKHSRSILNKFSKHLGLGGRKNHTSIFVPAPVSNNKTTASGPSSNGLRAPQSTAPSTSSPSSPTPPPRRMHPPHSGSVSNLDAYGSDEMPDSVGNRRTSVPARPPHPSSRPFVPMAHLSNMMPLNPLMIDTTGHSPTAGNGYDFAMGVLAENPNAFSDDLPPYRSISVPAQPRTRQPSQPSSSSSITPLEAQRIHFGRLKTALDADKVVQKELEQDLEALANFKIIQLPEMGVVVDVSPDQLEAVKREKTAIQSDIDELRRKIASYERNSGFELPPQLPPKPHARASSSRSASDEEWACLRCTALNHAEIPRCEYCLLPRIIAKPSNEAVASVSGMNAAAAAAPCYCCSNSNSTRQSTDRSPHIEYERLVGMAPPPDHPMDSSDGGDSGWVMVDVVMGPPPPPLAASSHV